MTDTNPHERQTLNRLKLLLIIGIPFVLMAAAYFVYFTGIGIPEGTKNKGILIRPPQQLSDIPIRFEGQPYDYRSEAEPRWSILIAGSGDCEASCAETLYLTRQIHIALGKYQHRVRRMYLQLDDRDNSKLLDLISREHPHLQVFTADRQSFSQLLAASDMSADPSAPGTYFIVDPQGFVMMYYTAEHDGKDAITDMKFLLKFSSEE